MSAAPDVKFGRFEVLESLGAGGMGAVFRARDRQSGLEVALKVILPERRAQKELAERFAREARAIQAISHPNVARCTGHGEENGHLWLSLELAERGSLADRLKTGPLDWREAVRVSAAIARGLAAIHAAGIVHRDLKPANILVDRTGAPRISDFGLASGGAGVGGGSLTRTGQLLGTFAYMAPEQSDGGREATPASDVYALGCTLHALLTGAPPFEGEGPEVITKHLLTAPRAPSTRVGDIPPAVDALVLRLLEKEPARRGTATETAAALEALEKSVPGPRPRGLVVAGVGVAILTSGLVAAATLGRAPAPAPSPPVAAPQAPSRAAAPTGPRRPAWFDALGEDERPPFPLPRGLAFGNGPGEYVNEVDGSVLVFVPATTFPLGLEPELQPCANGGDEHPVREKRLSAYFIGKYEVSTGQFQKYELAERRPDLVARSRGCFTPHPVAAGDVNEGPAQSLFITEISTAPELPVVCVSWDDARDYARWAKLRLPTEAEWECAAGWDRREKRKRLYPWGDTLPRDKDAPRANVADLAFIAEPLAKSDAGERRDLVERLGPLGTHDDGHRERSRVGEFPGGASPVGALDMAGNVSEWVQDIHASYKHLAEVDPIGTTAESDVDTQYVYRGGSYGSTWQTLHVTHRRKTANVKGEPRGDRGFRVALSLADPRRKR